jgi:23S rRNA (adenine2503-C2)-methyltransferase
MGMGEPLDNLENVTKAVKIFKEQDGLSIGARRQTISTSGLSHQITKLGQMNLGVLLAISLHAVDDALRETLMPINKAYNIESVINAVKAFPIDQRKRVMFEYLVMKDLNDNIKSAKKLVKLLHGIKAKVNLIYFNPYPGSPYQRPDTKTMETFKSYLNDHGITCTIRQSKGLDISAACGQLKEKTANEIS